MTITESTWNWPDLLTSLLAHEHLSAEATERAMEEVMTGNASPVQLAGFLVGLRAKGETPAEVNALVTAALRHSVPLSVPGPVVDLVGTGGDGANTVNISTMAAVVAAAAGARVVKHGNRAASSSSGSADVLEALGVRLDLSPEQLVRVAEELGLTFCFAQHFHPALRHAAPIRRELGVPTVLNLLGPMLNPARPAALAVGVGLPGRAPLMAETLARTGTSALVFRGDDGLDELTVTTTSQVWTVHRGEVTRTTFDPRDVGIPLAAPDALRGADSAHNAAVARSVLNGARGPVRDAVLLSAAAALTALLAVDEPATAHRPLTERLADQLPHAAEAIDSGAAATLLENWAQLTTRLAE